MSSRGIAVMGPGTPAPYAGTGRQPIGIGPYGGTGHRADVTDLRRDARQARRDVSVPAAAVIPVAFRIGAAFKPGARLPLETVVRWNSWDGVAAG
jgi:hypothetical protein